MIYEVGSLAKEGRAEGVVLKGLPYEEQISRLVVTHQHIPARESQFCGRYGKANSSMDHPPGG